MSFDYLTYFIMLYVFNAWANPALFHTGCFVESLFTQTLVIVVAEALLTVSPLAGALGFVPLPPLY